MKKHQKRFTVDREAWAKVCAVEGIVRQPTVSNLFAEFDRLGLDAAQRRARVKEFFAQS
jgi:hypothetical protein